MVVIDLDGPDIDEQTIGSNDPGHEVITINADKDTIDTDPVTLENVLSSSDSSPDGAEDTQVSGPLTPGCDKENGLVVVVHNATPLLIHAKQVNSHPHPYAEP